MLNELPLSLIIRYFLQKPLKPLAMKKYNTLVALLAFTILSVIIVFASYPDTIKPEKKVSKYASSNYEETIQEGDLIFQISQSAQCIAVQAATKSSYSHCGILFKEDGKWLVLEAVQPVKYTPLKSWIESGKNNHYVVKRLKESEKILTPEVIAAMKKEGKSHIGKNYDITFEWSDNKMYCSEIIWKIYQRTTGIEIGKLEKLKDFDLTNAIVKPIVEQRYGDNIPYDETVISPVSIMKSEVLFTVK